MHVVTYDSTACKSLIFLLFMKIINDIKGYVLFQVAGALAEFGKSLETITETAREVANSIGMKKYPC